MTDKQIDKIKAKIKKVRSILAAEKRKFGGFDDSRGLRYLPTELYVKMRDYTGGLKYLKWFNKNFPDDIGVPEFLFEATVILFQTKHLKEAEDYALKTYFSNTFLFDKYFTQELKQVDKNFQISFQRADYIKNFPYRHDHDDFLEFSDWLNKFFNSDRFIKTTNEFNKIERQLETEPIGPKRTMLVRKLYRLI